MQTQIYFFLHQGTILIQIPSPSPSSCSSSPNDRMPSALLTCYKKSTLVKLSPLPRPMPKGIGKLRVQISLPKIKNEISLLELLLFKHFIL